MSCLTVPHIWPPFAQQFLTEFAVPCMRKSNGCHNKLPFDSLYKKCEACRSIHRAEEAARQLRKHEVLFTFFQAHDFKTWTCISSSLLFLCLSSSHQLVADLVASPLDQAPPAPRAEEAARRRRKYEVRLHSFIHAHHFAA